MKYSTIIWVLILGTFCLAYTYGITFVNNQYVPADYVVQSNQITKEVSDRISKRYNMKVIGVTAGLMNCVNALGLDFHIQGPLSKEQLRIILVDSVEEFLTLLNEDERIRPFLKEYPFPADGIQIAIFVKDKERNSIYYPEITVASVYNGKLFYRSKEKDVISGYKLTEEESYETALKLVKGNSHD